MSDEKTIAACYQQLVSMPVAGRLKFRFSLPEDNAAHGRVRIADSNTGREMNTNYRIRKRWGENMVRLQLKDDKYYIVCDNRDEILKIRNNNLIVDFEALSDIIRDRMWSIEIL